MRRPKLPRQPIACAICGKEFVPSGRGRRKYCSLECAAEAERQKAKVRDGRRAKRTACYGVRNRDGSFTPLSRPQKTYAEIQAANRANPIKTGWRGQPRAGGRSASAFFST